MTHYHEIHRALYDALCEAAAGWPPEAIQDALAAGRRTDRLLRAAAWQREDEACAAYNPNDER